MSQERMTGAEAIRHLFETRKELVDRIKAAGADGTTDSDTMCEAADAVTQLVKPRGVERFARVSRSATISAGDYVAYARELTSENATVTVSDTAELLDAVVVDNGRVVVMYAEAGCVNLKVVTYKDGTLRSGEAYCLPDVTGNAVLCKTDKETIAVLYSTETAGVINALYVKDLTLSPKFDDLWADSPVYNIAACQLRGGVIAVAYMERGDNARGAELLLLGVSTNICTLMSSVHFAEGCSRAEYERMIHMAALDSEYIILSWFEDYASPVRWAVAYLGGDDKIGITPANSCVYQGSVGRTSFAADNDKVLFANAVIKAAADPEAKPKSAVTLEMWQVGDTPYSVRPSWYAKANLQYNDNLSLVGAAPLDAKGALVTWSRGGSAFASIVPYVDANAVPIPAVAIGGCSDAYMAVKLTRSGTLVAVLRGIDGGVRLDIYRTSEVVVPLEASELDDGKVVRADGLAMEAAAGGGTVKIAALK